MIYNWVTGLSATHNPIIQENALAADQSAQIEVDKKYFKDFFKSSQLSKLLVTSLKAEVYSRL